VLIIPNFARFAAQLRKAKARTQTNPPRPQELTAIYERLDKWAKRSLGWLTESTKMNKPVAGHRWMIRGIAFMSADDAKRFARADPAAWGLTPSEAEQLPNMCPRASGGCRAVCLVSSGQMGLPASSNAQMRRTIAFQFERDAFFTMEIIAIAQMAKAARKAGQKLGIRLNVTSDLDWENMAVSVDPWLSKYLTKYGVSVRPGKYNNICEVFPKIVFYDYTKVESRMDRYIERRGWPSNYHLTWSLAENALNRIEAIKVLTTGAASVAVPFNVRSRKISVGVYRPLPKTLTIVDNSPGKAEVAYTFAVVDADKHDLRFMDPGRYSSDGKSPGVFAGLRFKVPKRKALKGMTADQKAIAGGEFVIRAVDPAGKLNEHPIIKVFKARSATSAPLSATNPPKDAKWFGAMRDVMLEIRRRKAAKKSNPRRWRRR
jgi:hypothetical protein